MVLEKTGFTIFAIMDDHRNVMKKIIVWIVDTCILSTNPNSYDVRITESHRSKARAV